MSADHDRVRTQLHRGDPAAGRALSPEDLARIRRTVLAEASPARSRGPWPRLRLAWVGVPALAIVGLALGLALVPGPPPPSSSAPVAPVARATLRPPATPWTLLPEPPPLPADPVPPRVAAAAATSRPLPTGPIAAERASRTLRFRTGATRIVWILNPSLELEPNRGETS